jgi:hypothetical protein
VPYGDATHAHPNSERCDSGQESHDETYPTEEFGRNRQKGKRSWNMHHAREVTHGASEPVASKPNQHLLRAMREEGKAIASPSSIKELAFCIVAKNDCIEVLWAGGVPADHEFLSFVDAHLTPGAGASTGFTQDVQVFRDYPFETLSAHGAKYVREARVQLRTLTPSDLMAMAL